MYNNHIAVKILRDVIEVWSWRKIQNNAVCASFLAVRQSQHMFWSHNNTHKHIDQFMVYWNWSSSKILFAAPVTSDAKMSRGVKSAISRRYLISRMSVSGEGKKSHILFKHLYLCVPFKTKIKCCNFMRIKRRSVYRVLEIRSDRWILCVVDSFLRIHECSNAAHSALPCAYDA